MISKGLEQKCAKDEKLTFFKNPSTKPKGFEQKMPKTQILLSIQKKKTSSHATRYTFLLKNI